MTRRRASLRKMADPADLFNIVVVGDMNPRLHSPHFYRHIDVIDEAELQAALASDQTMCMAQVAQVPFNDVRVLCLPNRWEVATPKLEATDRLLDVAERVMKALDHTPVTAFGFNFEFARPDNRSNICEAFAANLRLLGWGFDETGISANASQVRPVKVAPQGSAGKSTVAIGAMHSTVDWLIVKNNFNYDIKMEAGFHFDLSNMMRSRFAADRDTARIQLERSLKLLEAN